MYYIVGGVNSQNQSDEKLLTMRLHSAHLRKAPVHHCQDQSDEKFWRWIFPWRPGLLTVNFNYVACLPSSCWSWAMKFSMCWDNFIKHLFLKFLNFEINGSKVKVFGYFDHFRSKIFQNQFDIHNTQYQMLDPTNFHKDPSSNGFTIKGERCSEASEGRKPKVDERRSGRLALEIQKPGRTQFETKPMNPRKHIKYANHSFFILPVSIV